MKNTLLILALAILSLSSLNAQTWGIRYDCNVLPTAGSPAWVVKDTAVSAAFVDSSKYLKFNAIPPTAKGDWNNTVAITNATGATTVFRVKATPELITAYNANTAADYRLFEMEIRTGTVREQIWVLAKDSISLIKAAVKGRVANSLDWHIYRITIKDSLTTVYLDENPTPICSGKTTDAGSTAKEFRIGNQSTTIAGYGQYLDWVLCDVTGAYSPTQKTLPADLAAQIPTAVQDGKAVVNNYKLNQNYPNPFNPSTKISFNLEKTGYTELSVYNMLGQKVASLFSGVMSAGSHEFSFDASRLQSGVYVYQLKSGSFSQTRKMMLLK